MIKGRGTVRSLSHTTDQLECVCVRAWFQEVSNHTLVSCGWSEQSLKRGAGSDTPWNSFDELDDDLMMRLG